MASNLKNFCQNRGLHIGHLNVRSIRNKYLALSHLVLDCKPKILALSETWLSLEDDNAMLNIPGYTVVRQDRAYNKRGGGLLIYVNEDLVCTQLGHLSVSTPDLEAQVIQISYVNCRPIYIINIYKPPSAQAEISLQRLSIIIDEINQMHASAEIHLLGDFNIDNLQATNADSKRLKTFMLQNHLSQSFKECTHDAGGCIDNHLTNRPEIVLAKEVMHLGLSDHSLIIVNRKIDHEKTPTKQITARTFMHFSEGNFQDSLSSIDWSSIFSISQPQCAWEAFLELLIPVIDAHAPYKLMKIRVDNAPWVNYEYISASHDRDHFTKRWRRLRQEDERAKMRHFRNLANKMAEGLKADHIQQEIRDNRGNPTALWKAVKSYLPKSGASNLIPKCNESLSDLDHANQFNETFCNIGQNLAQSIPPPPATYQSPPIPSGLIPFVLCPLDISMIHRELTNLPIH